MRVTERMRRNMAHLGPADSIAQAAHVLAQQGVRAIPIVRRSSLVGMLGEADVALARPSAATTLSFGEIGGRLAQIPIGAILAGGVIAVGPRTPLTEAIRLMRARRLAALPVLRGDELLGVLTEEDLLDLLAEVADSPS
ncbi:MAG: CBS domain-containing protein [Candidatus Rokubacteria bacterium]|nr:CBS domain-containing protein [Candidatus Rokubacteria bacterium]